MARRTRSSFFIGAGGVALACALAVSVGLASQPIESSADLQSPRRIAAQPTERADRFERSTRPLVDDTADGSTLPVAIQDIAMEIIDEIDPHQAATLTEIRQRRPAEFARVLRMARRITGLAQLKQINPELFQVRMNELRLELVCQRLAAQVRIARECGDSPMVANLERELRTEVTKLVNEGLRARTMEFLMLEEHIEKMRKQLTADANDMPGTVERRMHRFLTERRTNPVLMPIGGDE